MRIALASIFVDDQRAARAFYTEVLGLVVKNEVPVGDDLWLTVVSRDDPEGTELLLEPSGHPAVGPYRAALRADGIPLAQLEVADLASEHERLRAAGVVFTQDPVDIGSGLLAVFDDTCGNLVQLFEPRRDG
ncbi:VOC family protein [Sanguibacter sp. HDW7]|uniref:VOC family protein n=1 Tax=Sanguibacter sp. HDW7 TaxID=2714931 RepID=UPI00140E6B3B|nr:VOC family protein [Sanguibacter sp. HDW7]QIK83874.1 VOC family protein [Sanguibacter sp. HDW7]